MEKEIKIDKDLISYCGLYCGACGKFLNEKCPGCRKNEKASWCKIRKCNMEQSYHTCADCQKNVSECKTYSNFISKLFGLIFHSDRKACISRIKDIGEEAFAKEMSEKRIMTLKKK